MILILSLLIIAAAIWFALSRFADSGARAQIIVNGAVVKTVSLDRDMSFSVDGLPNVGFEIKNGEIAFAFSDCPDQICVHSGFMHRAGESAACLPNRAALKITGKGGVDAVV